MLAELQPSSCVDLALDVFSADADHRQLTPMRDSVVKVCDRLGQTLAFGALESSARSFHPDIVDLSRGCANGKGWDWG